MTIQRPALTLLLASLLLVLTTVFVGLPAVIYGANSEQFEFTFVELVGAQWPVALAAALLIVIPAFVLPARWARWWAILMAAVAVYVWAHGLFQTHSFGALDGRNWSADVPFWQSGADLVLSLGGMALVAYIGARWVSAAAIGLLVLSAGMIAQAIPQLNVKNSRSSAQSVTLTELASMSSSKNGLVVLMDTMQSDVFEEVLQENINIRNAMDGFTFYPDTTSISPTTYLSMPSVHSGKIYDPGEPLFRYFTESVQKNSVLSDISRAGYYVNLVNPIQEICPESVRCVTARTALLGRKNAVRAEALRIFDSVVFRIAPLALKTASLNQGRGLLQYWVLDDRAVQRSSERNEILRVVSSMLSPGAAAPTLNFFHLFGTHPPYVFGSECQLLDVPLPDNRENFKQQTRCSLEAFVGLLKSLEERGLYDRTAIVLMADHGNPYATNSRSNATPAFSRLAAGANPAFAVKPIDSRGAFKIDNAPISLPDFGATICDMLRDCMAAAGTSALARPEPRPRTYFNYLWRHGLWRADTIPGLTAYSISGPVWERESWTKSPERPVDLRPGQLVSFGDGAIGSKLDAMEWNAPESWGAWTASETASFEASIPDGAPATVQMQVQGFLGVGSPIALDVLVDGEVALSTSFTPGNSMQLLKVPIASRAAEDGVVEIQLRVPRVDSPQSLGLSEDPRPIGVGVHWIRLDRAG
jgi:hypothetical protein